MKNNDTFVIPAPIPTFVRTGTGMTIKSLGDLNLEMALIVKWSSTLHFIAHYSLFIKIGEG